MSDNIMMLQMDYTIPMSLEPLFEQLEEEGFFKVVKDDENDKSLLVSMDDEDLEKESVKSWVKAFIDSSLNLDDPDIAEDADLLLEALENSEEVEPVH